MDLLDGFRLPSKKHILEISKNVLVPHYIVNLFLSLSFYLLKTIPPICEYMFDDCTLELKHWEWVTFLGCVIVLKNRKQATAGEYISVACMFSKVLSLVLFYQVYVPYAFVYALLCLGHFIFLPRPVYKGPDFVTYFRGPHLQNEINSDKRVTWMICFYAAWSPACVTVAPIFAELSNEYHLDNFKFGKLDVSRYSDVAEEFRINTSSFSKQLPTIVLFKEGKEVIRRPAMSPKGTVVKYMFTKENIKRDFEMNETYNQCKKKLPKPRKESAKDKKEQ